MSWLKLNLGPHCLGALTGQDTRALRAAVQIVELYQYCDDSQSCAQAFGLIVRQMQPSTRRLAFHAIAMLTEWEYRATLWELARLPPFSEHPGVCKFERQGAPV